MKKNFKAIIFCVFIVLSITACSPDVNNDENNGINITIDDPVIVNLSRDWNKNENSIPFRLAFNPSRYDTPANYEFVEELSWWHTNYDPSFMVISSMDELNGTLDELNEGDNVYDHTILRGEYSESFFSENILILWTVFEGSGSHGNWVYSLDVNGETLIVNTLRFNVYDSGLGGTDDVKYWVFEIQVNKEDITGVTTIEMDTKWIRLVPNCVTITIHNKYFSKVKNESFTIKDFRWNNISEIHYTILSGINMHWVTLGLKTPGTKNAKALAEHLETLDFVDEVYGWTFTYLNY